MEGLRGFAVGLVFLVHFTTLVEPWLPSDSITLRLAHGLRGVGNTGVDLFFVLSGYLIYGHLITRKPGLIEYFQRRLRRIYPCFLVVLAVYIVAMAVAPEWGKWPSAPISAALYLGANVLLLPGVFPIEPIIAVSWSLSYEAAYYIATPLVITVFRLRAWLPTMRVLLLATMVLLATIWQNVHGGNLRWIMFLGGAILFEAASRPASRFLDRSGPFLLILGLGSIWMLRDVDGTGPLRVWILFAMYPLVCFAAFTGRGLVARAASWLPLRIFGNMSYSYYLIHGLTLNVCATVLSQIDPPADDQPMLLWLGLLPAFVVTLVPAAILFLLIERPLSLVRPSRAPEGRLHVERKAAQG